MARRKHEELPDLTKSQSRWEGFSRTWEGVSPHEETRRREMAQRLVEGRLPPGYLQGSSTGALFDP